MITVKQIFDLALKMGMEADPRGKDGLEKYLAQTKKTYEDLKPSEKDYFDQEILNNPYGDSRVHAGKLDAPVERVLAGIDVGPVEVILASQLNERGKKIDLVIGHHPVGRSLAGLHDVMDMQVEVFVKAGVPVHIAEKIMEERIKEVGRSVHPSNHYQIVDAANLLGINLINVHTPTDNLVKQYLRKFLDNKKPDTIGDLVEALLEQPEYAEAKRRGTGPKLFSGQPINHVGKFIVEMTGGTSPSDKIYEEVSRAGVSTIIGMHMKEESNKKAIEHHLNVLVAGHMASDSLGLNLFLDELEQQGVEIVPCSGLIRVKRK